MLFSENEWSRKSLRKRSERRLKKLKLISRRPQKRHEQHEQREQRFKINNLQRERRKIKSEHHEHSFIINDLALTWFISRTKFGRSPINRPSERSERGETKPTKFTQ